MKRKTRNKINKKIIIKCSIFIISLLFILVGIVFICFHNTSIENIYNTDKISINRFFKTDEANVNENNNVSTINYMSVLEIPKIHLKQGIPFPNSKDNNVDRNILVINGSDTPDKDNGAFILASHSGTSSISYFKNLYKLKVGDTAYIYYKNDKYIYSISKIYEVKKTKEIKIERDPKRKSLILITCTKNKNDTQTIYVAYEN